MWKYIYDCFDIVVIINGIYQGIWVDQVMFDVVEVGKDFWELYLKNKWVFIDFVKCKNGVIFDEEKLIIGFVCCFVFYKCSDLIFFKFEVIEFYLKEGKIQFVFFGCVYFLDDIGKVIVVNFVCMFKFYFNVVVFLENYDMEIGVVIICGFDVWFNNLCCFKEVSGMFGMKVFMNGVFNFSVFDGWWLEVCQDGVNGWQIGNVFESDNVEEQDDNDWEVFYDVLLNKVVFIYYDDW